MFFMLRNYYTLYRIAGELECLVGCPLADCFSQEKDVAMFAFLSGDELEYLQISTDTLLSGICLRKNFDRKRRNTADIFPQAKGDVLQSIELSPADRIIKLDFIRHTLHIYLFGGSRSNIILTDKGGTILDSSRHKKALVGTKLAAEESNSAPKENLSDSVATVLSNAPYLLGKYYTEEICRRLETDPKAVCAELREDARERLLATAKLFAECLRSGTQAYIYRLPDGNPLVSLAELGRYGSPERIEEAVSQAVFFRTINTLKHQSIDSAKKGLASVLNRLVKKYEMQLEHHRDSASHSRRAEEYQTTAQLLLSLPNQKGKPGEEIELDFPDGSKKKVKLEKLKTINENAGRYFAKAKDARENAQRRKMLIPRTEERLATVRAALADLGAAEKLKDIERIKQQIYKIPDSKMQDNNSEESKYRVFDLGDGYTLYVGKNAANNDELTMKFARPNDLWFHARGSSGSHAVLRLESGDKPPKYIIQRAASVAAYYSGAKNAKYTPVCYTFKKNVRKPKGAAVGAVTVTREEVILVEPKLPAGSQE